MKKILFITSRLPFPATSGRKTSLYNYCKLLKTLQYELIVASFMEYGDVESDKPEFIDKLIILPEISNKEKIINLVIKTFLTRKFPMQVSLYWSKESKKVVDDLIYTEKPNIVIADMVRTTEYLKSAECFKIADLDDMLSLRYKRQLKVDLNNVNPYGKYFYKLPKFIRKILMNNNIKKVVLKQEINLLENYELDMGRIFDKTIFVAEKETNILNKGIGKNKAITVPIGVDIEYFSYQFENIVVDRNKIAFMGVLNVAHNENAVIHFIEDIFPIILQKRPDTQFIIIGGGITEKLNKYMSSNIIFTGRVDDIRPYVKQCRVFVCPLTFGSGIKTKNLEAMAMSVPVVTTTVGAENINAVNGKHWIVANNPREFADSVIDLINNNKKYQDIRTCGQKYVQSHWTWCIARNIFEQFLPK